MKKILCLSLYCVFANAFCYEPSEPFCINNEISSNYDFNSCKRQVENFIREMQDYSQCLLETNQEKVSNVIEKFNCQASGESFCY